MQTVPSLVGSGTAVAAAALGLVFARPDGDLHPTSAVRSRPRPHTEYGGPSSRSRLSSAPASSRPGTSSASRVPYIKETQYNNNNNNNNNITPLPDNFSSGLPAANSTGQQHPQSSQLTPPRANQRRQPSSQHGDAAEQPIAENARDSVSSAGSWIRRLSLRPLSQHGSFLSSTGPDTQSIAFSHRSSAPILSPTGSVPGPLPPNKLVKRTSSIQPNGPVARPLPPKFSFDQQILHEDVPMLSPIEVPSLSHQEEPRWVSLFHSRAVNVNVKGNRATPERGLDRSSPPLSKRIRAFVGEKKTVYLVKGGMIAAPSGPVEAAFMSDDSTGPGQDLHELERDNSTSEGTPAKSLRRSISFTFSPNNPFSRAGSLRRPKRGVDPKGENNARHVSAPMPQGVARSFLDNPAGPASDAGELQPTPLRHADGGSAPSSRPMKRSRNASSPLPPLSHISTFNFDVSKGVPPPAVQLSQPDSATAGSLYSATTSSLRMRRQGRSSTLNSSDMEVRGFQSGDDDDTDFKSDTMTMFDSVRTMASGRNQAPESPAESMFDESPPSTAVKNNRTKRLSIQEILGRAWEADDRIMEEDESIPTPVRERQERIFLPDTDAEGPAADRLGLERPSLDLSVSNRDVSRFSFDDEFDDEWAREEEEMGFGNHLSPPGSTNSRGVSSNLRLALADGTGEEVVGVPRGLRAAERPRSNIFDWTESVTDKVDADGHFLRPRTVHGKHEMDMRGGRPSNRKGPFAAHVRSQSVPALYEPPDAAKGASQKYGTWGLGTKGASEDWDDDFEFGSADSGEGIDCEDNFAMVVPASIQASQPSLKQHSGQIRELSLLVNDLKRLCRHGRDLDLVNGTHAGLWKEAEGIITLASPDEDELEGMDVESSELDFEHSILSERAADEELDPDLLKKLEDPFETPPDLRMAKTTVIRERPSGRRRSVFSPDDDIFGGGNMSTVDASNSSRPKTPENNINMGGRDVTDIVKSVLDAMQQRSTSGSSHASGGADDKVHFGTNNLKALVKRASDLRDSLSEVIRRADQITQSPARTPRRSDRGKESPAFTRVFTPESRSSSSPPRRLPHSRSSNSALGRVAHDASPSSGLSQRMQMMTVS
ncbi:hypothetical protein SODALDRAFT_284780 [Sodiomyces alkalinus F11]|uniref:Uncharacterized protein n=1 Tax=Sodiomyces alkalinus (strain CBS 110278 / VKM F-3762 / F11) TaxID=1314773 RepID=A0A3N2PK30_SODAK|nr:hypothetical protein SODALDRAFT_284780 [Sodiomyces alkalinus F11]ROT34892.1 hypothetical protein SODALDRAFT_284780 [Sodiomyces alkalinus F11]